LNAHQLIGRPGGDQSNIKTLFQQVFNLTLKKSKQEQNYSQGTRVKKKKRTLKISYERKFEN
jgi:hypothetical protein